MCSSEHFGLEVCGLLDLMCPARHEESVEDLLEARCDETQQTTGCSKGDFADSWMAMNEATVSLAGCMAVYWWNNSCHWADMLSYPGLN